MTGYNLAFGDADRDGHQELYAWVRYWDSLYAFEHVARDSFSVQPIPVPLEPGSVLCHDLADADGDGRLDLVASVFPRTGRRLMTIESPDSTSLPSETTTVFLLEGRQTDCANVTDLDQDSFPEVTFSRGNGVRVWESNGNNVYDSVAYLDGHGYLNCHATGDIDQDGKNDVAFVAEPANLYVYESEGDNRFRVAAVCTTSTDGIGIAVAICDDMDGDGYNEIVLYGQVDTRDFNGSLEVWECKGDDDYQVVWQRYIPFGFDFALTSGDIDGDKHDEFAFHDGATIYLYDSPGNDQYEVVWSQVSEHSPIYMHDINGNGRDELIHLQRFDDTILTVIRGVPDSGGVAERKLHCERRVRVAPTQTRGTLVRVAGIAGGAEVEVVDASGQVVARPKGGVWNPRGVSPGAYFVRVRSGSQAVVQKVLVLR
jgi:hypothetical protein